MARMDEVRAEEWAKQALEYRKEASEMKLFFVELLHEKLGHRSK
jgi:hypothetical protein